MSDLERLAEEILAFLKKKPAYFCDVLREFKNENYRNILLAWGELRAKKKLLREESSGKYLVKD
jgi:hypothetical protein